MSSVKPYTTLGIPSVPFLEMECLSVLEIMVWNVYPYLKLAYPYSKFHDFVLNVSISVKEVTLSTVPSP